MSTVELDTGKMSLPELKAALISLGFTVEHPFVKTFHIKQEGYLIGTYDGMTGKLVTKKWGRDLLQDVAPAYSKQVLLGQAKRFGWRVSEQKDGRLLVQKGSL